MLVADADHLRPGWAGIGWPRAPAAHGRDPDDQEGPLGVGQLRDGPERWPVGRWLHALAHAL
eukprot:8397782-Pyramimonas_sp.AAC.1